MKKTFFTFTKEIREIKRNESNLLLNCILKFTSTCYRWEGDLQKLISIFYRFEKVLEGDPDYLELYVNSYIFTQTLKKIRPNLSIRGIKIFITTKNGKTHIAIDKNLDNDFLDCYFDEEFMFQQFD